MTEQRLDALFGIYSEAVFAVSGSEFIYCNNAARKLLPGISEMKPGDIFPNTVLELESDSFVGEIDIAGKRSTYSAAQFDSCRIFSVLSCDDSGDVIDVSAFSALSLEMKQYLAVLKLASSIVLPFAENNGDERLGNYAAMINHSYYNILRLTTNMELLGYEPGDSSALNRTVFNLVEMCSELVGACMHLVEGRSINLSFSSAEERIPIWADKSKLEQMLLNMISNSLTCTERGGNITVSAALSNECALIKVSDTGGGIADEVKSSAWNRYSQSRILSDGKSGAGFGMAAISQIARMHGGSVFFESRANEGTTVTASIPLGNDRPTNLNTGVAVYQSDGISPYLLGLSTVLEFDKFKQKYMD